MRLICKALPRGRPTDNRSLPPPTTTVCHISIACRSTAGSPDVLLKEYSLDPTWSPGGHFIVYSGPDVGTSFGVKAMTPGGAVHPLPGLTLPRGSRRMAFLSKGLSLVMLRGEIQHKDLWLIDLETGAERQLTRLAPDFNISDFDISPDGSEALLERVQERSSVVLLDVPAR